MNTNHIEFSIECSFLFDRPIELNLGNLKITLTSSSKVLLVRFECDEEVVESEFEDQVAMELEGILDKISFTYLIKFGEPFMISKSIANKAMISNRMTGKFSIVSPPLTNDQIAQLKLNLEGAVMDSTLLRMYRFALKNDNAVDQFMFLYGIIFMLYHNQENVDKFIQTRPEYNTMEDKDSGNPRRTSKETIYTWLRNQVGHVKRRTDIVDVRSEIQRKLSSFQRLVKRAIIEKSRDLSTY